MNNQPQNISSGSAPYALRAADFEQEPKPSSNHDFAGAFQKVVAFKDFFQKDLPSVDHVVTQSAPPSWKTSFLVFKHNKYFTVPVEKIAFFQVKYECAVITCFDKQEYLVNYSLEQIQNLLAPRHFFRLNRQYLINFLAIKEVEHYFARKLLVLLSVATKEKLLVSKEKSTNFLQWLDNR